ncbi:MAG: hypothetical protein ABI460_03340, partial [Caldimonas sp.]
MSLQANFALKSYVKSTVGCMVLVAAALLLAVLGPLWLPKVPGAVVAASGLLAALGAATLACACAVVLVRHKRAVRGESDLFLELNQSRDPAAIMTRTAPRTTRLRRWL